jgi:rare lipoprotein A
MLVPVPPAQSAAPLAPIAILAQGAGGASAPSVPQLSPPLPAALSVRWAKLNVLDGQQVSVTGALAPALPKQRIVLQARIARSWRTLATAFTGAQGRYRLRYRPGQIGAQRVRVRFAGDIQAAAASRLVGHLDVFRLAGASWYGGGGGMACGGTLTSSTLGVANKTLPCGTLVTLRYHGRSVRVPVVDRGPYVAGRDFDLTEATKRALGFGDTGEVWSTR